MPPVQYRAGIDIGGTFTDIMLLGTDGSMHPGKILTTPDDYGLGIVAGLKEVVNAVGVPPSAIERVVHGTTVATNAILEGKGARTGLITTRGFRDVLEMRRLRIPEMYSLNYRKPEPLVPRRLRLEVTERTGPKGEIRIPLDDASVYAAANRLAEARVEAVAICLIHSYANPAHERRIAEIVREVVGDEVFVTLSSELLPVIREYERTSTTVINAYLGPAVKRYFRSLQRHLASFGVEAPLEVMKSDGGVMTVDAAVDRPSYIVESGPAAGVIGAANVSRKLDEGDAITLDMGGTTAKASMVEDGEVAKTADYEVGSGINLSSKLIMGGGYALKLPVIDISEIGAGGGSIVSIDAGGLMRVGPESAGAVPGPVAYGAGGDRTTFTDAAVMLGYLNPGHLVGGGLELDAEAARTALREQVARPLGKNPLDAAYGIYEVACGTMVRAVKAVTTYRGRDPRDFSIFAFGGNGPVVAAKIASMLEMRTVRIPPSSGVFSAYGLLLSDIEHEVYRAYLQPLADISATDLAAQYAQLDVELEALMAREGYAKTAYQVMPITEMRYTGQAHELAVSCPWDRHGRPDLAKLARAFGDEHERTYGHQAEVEAVECVTLRMVGRVATKAREDHNPLEYVDQQAARSGEYSGTRKAFFGAEHGLLDTPVVRRPDLLGAPQPGPVIIEEYDTTCVVPPGWTAQVDERGKICLTAE